MPDLYEDVETCVDVILERFADDDEIVVGLPLGIGKPNQLVDALVQRVVEQPTTRLKIWSALSLTTPDWQSELERRLVEPLVDRLFGDYPGLEYAERLQRGDLPDHVEVHEFFLTPGRYLDVPAAQQNYHSVNYTHALREIRESGIDVLAQMVGVVEDASGEPVEYNLSGNPDISADLIPELHDRRARGGDDAMIVGQVNRRLPVMEGDAPLEPSRFDAVVDHPRYDFDPFGLPREPVSRVDHLVGLRVASLLQDGGTLQIGIGSLGDAIAHAALLRHDSNETFRDLIGACGVREHSGDVVDALGGLEPFEEGLYGSTEMLVEGFLPLMEQGVLDRRVYDDVSIQRLLNDGRIDEEVGPETLDALLEIGAIDPELDADSVDYLQQYGILRSDLRLESGRLVGDEIDVPADLADDEARETIEAECLGEYLEGGVLVHAGFFLGSSSLYESLRELDAEARQRIHMRSVQFTNQLYRHEAINRLQRREARFANSAMKVTLLGAVVSDGLADQRVVSGVGGQFNFVNMAHELDGGRSIIMVRSTRESNGEVESNIVWNYGHVTIPRHLRDIVVTEYGIADLRGTSDREAIEAMIEIADARFQEQLVEEARAVGKLPDDYRIPDHARRNRPEHIRDVTERFERDGTLPTFPFGTELTDEELDLKRALTRLQEEFGRSGWRALDPSSAWESLRAPDAVRPHLERMDLAEPSSPREWLMRRVVAYALLEEGVGASGREY